MKALSPDTAAARAVQALRALAGAVRFRIVQVLAQRSECVTGIWSTRCRWRSPPLSEQEQQDMPRWAGCVSGALERSDYQARLAAAGFTDVAVTVEPVAEGEAARPWRSALITAYKPGAAGYRPDTSRRAAPRERSAVPGRQTGVACCGPDCCQH